MKEIRPFFARLALGGAVGLVAAIAYRSIQYGTENRVLTRPDCWTWRWLPFDAAWIGPYLTMFLLVGLPWFLLPEWRQVKRFARGLLAVAATGWVTFLVYPTACVRPGAEGQPWYYATLLVLDRPNNCLPCLHSAMSVLAAAVLLRSAAGFRPVIRRVWLVAWLALICLSIVALRQHTDIDMLVGVALGAVGAWWWSQGESPSRASKAG